MVMGLMFGGVGCHATIKGVELSNKLGYEITVALFFPLCPVYPVHTDSQHLF